MEGPGGPLLISAIDAIIAETLSGSAALYELIGAKDNLGASLMSCGTIPGQRSVHGQR